MSVSPLQIFLHLYKHLLALSLFLIIPLYVLLHALVHIILPGLAGRALKRRVFVGHAAALVRLSMRMQCQKEGRADREQLWRAIKSECVDHYI